MVIGFFTTDALIKLTHILPEECCHFVEGDHIQPIVQVGVDGSGNDEQFLVVASQLFKGVPAEVAGMCLFAVDQQYRKSGIFRKGSAEVTFQPSLEFSDRA